MTQKRTKAYLSRLFKDFREKIDKLGLIQSDAAEMLEITRSHLNKIINKRTNASLELIKKMENFTYGENVTDQNDEYDHIYIDTSHVDPGFSQFLKDHDDEFSSACKDLQEEQSFKIYCYLFMKDYASGFPEEEYSADFTTVEELQKRCNCTEEEVNVALNEMFEKKYLVTEKDENGTDVTNFVAKPK